MDDDAKRQAYYQDSDSLIIPIWDKRKKRLREAEEEYEAKLLAIDKEYFAEVEPHAQPLVWDGKGSYPLWLLRALGRKYHVRITRASAKHDHKKSKESFSFYPTRSNLRDPMADVRDAVDAFTNKLICGYHEDTYERAITVRLDVDMEPSLKRQRFEEAVRGEPKPLE